MSTWAQFISLPLTRLLQSKRLSLLKWIKYLCFSRFSSCYSRHIARCYSSCWVRFFRGLLAWCKKWSRLGVYWACNTHHLGQWIFHSSVLLHINERFSPLGALTGNKLFPLSFRVWNPKWRKINSECLVWIACLGGSFEGKGLFLVFLT